MNMTRKSGRQEIPVGKDGYVPIDAIVKRYHEVGDRMTDSRSDSDVVLPINLTPEQIAEWWNDPSVCDIQGIDTKKTDIYSVPASIRGRKRKALAQIAVITDTRKEADRIKKILAKHFTAEELETMTGGESLVISTKTHLSDCTGFYMRKQDGVPVPEIVFEEGTTEDGIVHEAVHHLRVRQGRMAFPTKNGKLDSSYHTLSKQKKDEIVAREEKETVIETIARTKIDPVQSGYYDRIPNISSRSAYLYDQKMVSNSRAMKGQRAIRAAERNYERASISQAVISANKKKRNRK